MAHGDEPHVSETDSEDDIDETEQQDTVSAVSPGAERTEICEVYLLVSRAGVTLVPCGRADTPVSVFLVQMSLQ